MKKITKITQAQKEKIPEYIEKYTRIVFGKTNRVAAEGAIKEFYEDIKEGEPKIVFCASPIVACLSYIKNGIDFGVNLDVSLADNLRVNLAASLADILRANLRASLYDGLHNTLRASLYDSLHNNLRANLYDSLDASNKIGGGYWFPLWWNCWGAMYQYAKKELGVKFDEERLRKMTQFIENVHFLLPHRGTCFVSDKPISILRNNDNRLHNENGMAVEYSDKTGIYALYGINFEKELYWKVVKKELSFADVIKINNVDQRAIAMKYLSFAHLVGGTKMKIVDGKTERGNELWKLPQSAGIFEQDEYFLHYFCPSSGREYVSAVNPEHIKRCGLDADALIAARHRFTLRQYLDNNFVST